MRSSISSSERWGLTWAVAVGLAVALIAWMEHGVRARGYRPSVTDDAWLWAVHRARISTDDPRTVALLGASRIQLGVSPRRLREELPGWTVAQLAVDGTSPIAALRDLAADDAFRGVAIVAVIEPQLRRAEWDTQQAYVDRYHRRWSAPGALLNRHLATLAQQRVALLSAGGRRMITGLVADRRVPPAPYLVTHADRSRSADYRMANLQRLRKKRMAGVTGSVAGLEPDAWLDEARAVEPFVRAIQARGGRVVFVRMPTSGPYLEVTELAAPRAQYWDRFAASTEAVTVHFQDHPSLAAFDCPDYSHLDMRDAPAFTSALVAVLRAQNVFL